MPDPLTPNEPHAIIFNAMSAFGAALRRARLSAGFSQEDLAERSGISVRAIVYLESGENPQALPANRSAASRRP